MTVVPNLTKLSSCLSMWLLLVSRAKRGVVSREAVDEDHHQQQHHNEYRTKRGKRDATESKNNLMDDLLGSMPLTLSQPENSDEELDTQVWGELSDELVDKVLARLPVPLLLQLRSVCKKWKERITSPSFLRLRDSAPHSGPHFVVFKPQNLKSFGAYDANLMKWYTIPLRGLDGFVVRMSSDGGLLCIVMRPNWYSGPTRILLYNPVINSEVLTLPASWVGSQIEAWIPSLVVLVVDQHKGSFKVVAAGCKGSPHGPECHCSVTEVYDSTTQKWERTGNLPWCCNSYDFASHVVCRGHIFCIATGFGDPKLMDYDIEGKVWRFFPLRSPHVGGAQGMLFERNGELMLVQQERGMHGVPEIYSWPPGSGSVSWSKVPTSLSKFGKKIEELFHFDPDLAWGAKGDLVFFVSQKWDRALLYNMARKECTLTPVSRFLKVDRSVLQAMPFDFNLQLLSN